MSTPNPYAAPKAAVADETVTLGGNFIPGGEARPAGNGWSWIASGWDLFKRQPGLWIGMGLLIVLIFAGAGMIPIAGGFLTTLFWPVFLGGIAIGCRTLDEGKDMELAHLFAGFQQNLGSLVAVGALTLVATLVIVFAVFAVMGLSFFGLMGADDQAMAAMAFTVLLAVLVIFALLLPVMMAAWFAPLLVVFHQLGAVDAMKQSFGACLKNVLPFLVYGLVLMVFMLLATLPLLLGWLVLWPVFAASIYTSYRDIYISSPA